MVKKQQKEEKRVEVEQIDLFDVGSNKPGSDIVQNPQNNQQHLAVDHGKDTEAPFGRFANGKPRKRPARPKINKSEENNGVEPIKTENKQEKTNKKQEKVAKPKNRPFELTIPGAKKIITANLTKAVEPWQIFDRLDDNMIVQELQGYIGEFPLCYSFQMQGKPVYGINYEGAIELAKICKGIMTDPRTPPTVIQESDKYLRMGAFVMDVVNKVGVWGVCSQSKFCGGHFDDKAFVKGASKCQRNGFLKLIPKKVKVSAIAEWIKSGKVQEVDYQKMIGGNLPDLLEAETENEKYENKTGAPEPFPGDTK